MSKFDCMNNKVKWKLYIKLKIFIGYIDKSILN